MLTITGIQILNRYFHSGLDWCVKFHTTSVKLFSRENCWPFLLIISELKMCVEYHRHSDIKQIFSFRAWLNVWNFIQILPSCFRENIVDLFWILMNWKYVDYHRHSDIKQIFSFRAGQNVWNFIQILSSCFREKIVLWFIVDVSGLDVWNVLHMIFRSVSWLIDYIYRYLTISVLQGLTKSVKLHMILVN